MGVMQSRAGRPGRDAEGLGNLGRGQPEVVMQDEERPLIRRQSSEAALELVSIRDLP
jgi:hypothetical protein